MDENTEHKLFLAELMIKKYGKEELVKLLSDECCIQHNPNKNKTHTAYIRDHKHEKTPFTDYDGHELDADLILIALDDAADQMSYSNWHTDKFDRAAECVIRYCIEREIKVQFITREERDAAFKKKRDEDEDEKDN